MLHCPYCGARIKEEESYCFRCGENLPSDLNERLDYRKKHNKLWYIPIITLLAFFLLSSTYYFFLQQKTTKAKQLYEQGEKSLLDEEYDKAKSFFERSLSLKKTFYQADVSLQFVNHASTIQEHIEESKSLLEENKFKEALGLLNESDQLLKNYYGESVNQLVEIIDKQKNEVEIKKLQSELDKKPNIDELKTLLWDAEAIKNDVAEEITNHIREQIVDYISSRASELLNEKQFNDAEILVEDGLKYVPDSEKLKSLKTTIDKEKTTFETAQQQRIEQATSLATAEQKANKENAIVLDHVDIDEDDSGRLVINGEVNSNATIPVSSILVEYTLIDKKKDELLTNKVFVYPEKLYPGEKGKFDFTHYDLPQSKEKIQVEVNKITWYTD